MNLLQSFGKFFGMFIDDEEHIQRSRKKACSNKPVQQQNSDPVEAIDDGAEGCDEYFEFDDFDG